MILKFILTEVFFIGYKIPLIAMGSLYKVGIRFMLFIVKEKKNIKGSKKKKSDRKMLDKNNKDKGQILMHIM